MKKKLFITMVCLLMAFTMATSVFAAPSLYRSEWVYFHVTKKDGADPDGLKSQRTRAIQTILRYCTSSSVHQNIAIDGSFGDNTHDAVRRFQNQIMGITYSQTDGSVGPATWPELYDELGVMTHTGGYYYFESDFPEINPSNVNIIRRGDTSGTWQVRKYNNGTITWHTFEYA